MRFSVYVVASALSASSFAIASPIANPTGSSAALSTGSPLAKRDPSIQNIANDMLARVRTAVQFNGTARWANITHERRDYTPTIKARSVNVEAGSAAPTEAVKRVDFTKAVWSNDTSSSVLRRSVVVDKTASAAPSADQSQGFNFNSTSQIKRSLLSNDTISLSNSSSPTLSRRSLNLNDTEALKDSTRMALKLLKAKLFQNRLAHANFSSIALNSTSA
jgi:hypothetical protein